MSASCLENVTFHVLKKNLYQLPLLKYCLVWSLLAHHKAKLYVPIHNLRFSVVK